MEEHTEEARAEEDAARLPVSIFAYSALHSSTNLRRSKSQSMPV